MRLLGFEDASLPHLLRSPATACPRRTRRFASDFDRISQYAYGEEEAFLSPRQGTTVLDVAIAETRRPAARACPATRRSSCTTRTASRST